MKRWEGSRRNRVCAGSRLQRMWREARQCARELRSGDRRVDRATIVLVRLTVLVAGVAAAA